VKTRSIAIFLSIFIPAAALIIFLGVTCEPAPASHEGRKLKPGDIEILKDLKKKLDGFDLLDLPERGDTLLEQPIDNFELFVFNLNTRRERFILKGKRVSPDPANPLYYRIVEPEVIIYSSSPDNQADRLKTTIKSRIARCFNNGSYVQVELEENVLVTTEGSDNSSFMGNPQFIKTERLWVLQNLEPDSEGRQNRRIITDTPISIKHDYYSIDAEGLDEDSATGATRLSGRVDATMESSFLEKIQNIRKGPGNISPRGKSDPYWMEIHCDRGAYIKSRFTSHRRKRPGKPPIRVIGRMPESMRFFGNVRLVRSANIVTARKQLTVFYPPDPPPGPLRPQTIVAEGGVIFEHDFEVMAEGDRAIIEPMDNRFEFIGNPAVLHYGQDTLHAPRIRAHRISENRYDVKLDGGVEGVIRSPTGETGWRLSAPALECVFELVPRSDPTVAKLAAEIDKLRARRLAAKKKTAKDEKKPPDPSKRVPVLVSLRSPGEPLHLYGSAGRDIACSALRFDRRKGSMNLTGDENHRPYFRQGDDFFAAGDRIETDLGRLDHTAVHVSGHVSGRTVRYLQIPAASGAKPGTEPRLEPNIWEFNAEEGRFHFARKEASKDKPSTYTPTKIKLSGRGKDFIFRELKNPLRKNLVTIQGGDMDLDMLAYGGNGSGTVLPRPGAKVDFAVGDLFKFESQKALYNGSNGIIAFEKGGIGRVFPRKKGGAAGAGKDEPWNIVFARLLIETDAEENISAWTAYPLPGKQVDISRPGIKLYGDRLRFEPPNHTATFSGNIRGRIEPDKHTGPEPVASDAGHVRGAWNFTASNLLAQFDDNANSLLSITVRDGVRFFADPGPHDEKAQFNSDVAVYETAVPKLSFLKGKNRPYALIEVYSESAKKALPNELRADRFELFPASGLLLASGKVRGDFHIADKSTSEPLHLRFQAPKMALRLRQEALLRCPKCEKWARRKAVRGAVGRCPDSTCRAPMQSTSKQRNLWQIDEVFAFDKIRFSSYPKGATKSDYLVRADTALYEGARGAVSLRGNPAEVLMRGQGRASQKDIVYDIRKRRLFMKNLTYVYPWGSDPRGTKELRRAFKEQDSKESRKKKD